MKARSGKLKFDRPYATWLDQALTQDPRLQLLALLPRIAIAAVELGWAHADPADRMIVASAQIYEAHLITADARIHESGLVRCIWD